MAPVELWIAAVSLGQRHDRPPFLFAHAARARFSGIGSPSAKSLNSSGNASYLSAAIVVAVCEDGRPLAFFEAKPRLNSPFLSCETDSSLLERKIAADESVSCLMVRCLYHFALLIFMASHGLVRDSDSLCGRAPRSRRRRSWSRRSFRLRSSLRAPFLTLTLPKADGAVARLFLGHGCSK
jgi:hypothetical protein